MLHTGIVVYAKIVGDRHRLIPSGRNARSLSSLAQQIDIHVETRNFRVDIFYSPCSLLAVGWSDWSYQSYQSYRSHRDSNL